MAAHGGTITHHHAVGTDHRAWAADEMGELGARRRRAGEKARGPARIRPPPPGPPPPRGGGGPPPRLCTPDASS
ncbi:FAD-linked oxidase C-terminal domain-containing protein [Dermacoccus sp. BD5]|uniref:FAD-linked oxidase C-terminal domain-containing protein n=1 Tax=Dermacoccus sp. BD5 TaxID=2953656 RepID=UPI0038465B94